MAEAAYEKVQDVVRDAISAAVRGTEFAPPEGAVLTDCVIVMGWYDADGDHGTSMVRCGSPWATRGLIVYAGEYADAVAQSGLFDVEVDDEGSDED